MASVPKETFSPESWKLFESASREYRSAQSVNAESPLAQFNIGVFLSKRKQFVEAEKALC
jgi:Tfp pilus assembly protein PilF